MQGLDVLLVDGTLVTRQLCNVDGGQVIRS
jgi:hypothetical protein